jgi:methylated-DNA-[protein]-cysteine S-methyltransferase
MTSLSRARIDTPVGPLTLLASDAGLRYVLWRGDSVDPAGDVVDDPDHPVLVAVIAQLEEYFAGERQEFDLPLDPQGTPFQLAAWEALRTIRYGETVTYGEQARRLGDARKARAIGAANGRNPISIIVPCHRVIGSDGSLTGFGGGIENKAWLLTHESSVLRGIPRDALSLD